MANVNIIALHNVQHQPGADYAPLVNYVITHTIRGGCQCGMCSDRGSIPDEFPGPTVDLALFKVTATGNPNPAKFLELTRAHQGVFVSCDPLDGKEHNFQELGGWIGDQSLALMYMGLGVSIGVFQLLSPDTILGNTIDAALKMKMARAGYVAVQAKR